MTQMKLGHARVQERYRDLAMGTWSPWSQCQNELEASSALAILQSQGELFGTLTLTESSGEKCREYRVDPMIKAQFLEHSEERVVRISDLHQTP